MPKSDTATTTRRIAGHTLTLRAGVTYRASRPFARRGRSIYPVTVAPLNAEAPAVTIHGLSYEHANRVIAAFNNGVTSFDGRQW